MGGAVTKRDLVRRIAAETKASTEVVRQIVQRFLDDLIDELAAGRRLEFRDFGVFEVVRRKPRTARNPRTGEPIEVPAKTVVHFKQGRIMRERVGECTLEPTPVQAEEPAEPPSPMLP
jgi:integration host factor subunit beta